MEMNQQKFEELMNEFLNTSLRIEMKMGVCEHTIGAKTSLPLKELMQAKDPADIIDSVLIEMWNGLLERLKNKLGEDLKATAKGE